MGEDRLLGGVCEEPSTRARAARSRASNASSNDPITPVQDALAHGRAVAITDAQGVGHPKMEPGHVRHLATVFGKVQVTRCAWRADGARNLYPADAALNLPERLHSHTLQRRAAIEATRGSFDTAQQALVRQCGNVAGKRQVEQLTMAAAADIDAFYQAVAPLPSSDDTLLVLSVDGKGW